MDCVPLQGLPAAPSQNPPLGAQAPLITLYEKGK